MATKIKLIWDFRGPNAERTAGHHAHHLEDFKKFEGIEEALCGTEEISPVHHLAYMVVDQEYMDDLRKRLKPHRGQRYSD